MSTRAAIGIRVGDRIHTIYCHYDGFPSHVGKILQEFYQSRDKANALVSGSHIRYFDRDGTVKRFNDGEFRINDTLDEALYGFDYLYVFNDHTELWECYTWYPDVGTEIVKKVAIK